MSIALVQSVLGGNATTTGTTISCTGSFVSTTTSGNLLVTAIWFTSTNATQPGAFTVTTPGLSWASNGAVAAAGGGADGGTLWKGKCQLTILPNAPSITAGTLTTVSNGAAGNGGTKILEFALFEFSGVSKATQAGCLDPPGLSGPNSSGTSSTPNPGNLTTTAADLAISMFSGETGQISAGSGYSLGPSPVAVQFGQIQYQLNTPIGTVATAFSGGTEAAWGACAAAFAPNPNPPPPPTTFSIQKLILSVRESNVPVRGRNQ